MKVVIMAGGKGTRISSVASDIPKPMIKVEGVPVLEREIECLKDQGFDDIIMTVSHLGNIIMDYFGDGSGNSPATGKPFGVHIEYYFEKEPLGNAGALFKIKDKLTSDFLLLNADAMFDVDFNRFVAFHRKHDGLVTLFTHPNSHPYDSGLIIANKDGSVKKWLAKEDERPQYYRNRVNAGLHVINVEESGWIRVPNMHEAIIPQKLFDTVQEVLKLDTCASKGQQTVNLFSGIVRCGGCGQNMVRRTVSKNGKKYIYLHCVTNHNGLGCSSHLISESKLAEVVLAALQGKVQQISGLEHRLDEINEIPKNERRLKSVEEHLKMLEQEEQKYQTLRRQLYEDMSSGIVSKEEYKEFSHSFNEKVETIRKAKAEMNRQRDCLNNLDVEHLPWIEDFKSYQNLTSLNRRVLVELVESITVYDKEHIHIQYRFDQEIRNVLEYCSSVPAAETEESAV